MEERQQKPLKKLELVTVVILQTLIGTYLVLLTAGDQLLQKQARVKQSSRLATSYRISCFQRWH